MLILGIESSTSQVGCAIGGPDGIMASAHTVRPRYHAESLVPQIEFVVGQAGIDISDIGAVAVDIGPGLFTGLRVGITTAISIAFASQTPMIVVDSLELLAHGVGTTDREIHSMIDARRGEIFHAAYRRTPAGLERITQPAVAEPDALAISLSETGGDLLLVGDGARRYLKSFQDQPQTEIATSGFDNPSASTLVEVAQPIAGRGEFVSWEEVRPLYLRAPDAKANWNPAEKTAP